MPLDESGNAVLFSLDITIPFRDKKIGGRRKKKIGN
jgi:hypothetical protein